MDALPIPVPAPIPTPRRPPMPFVAALVPVAAGVVMWLVTGSIYALCFAALGPLMIGGSLLDGARMRRRSRRLAEIDDAEAWARAEAELARRHDEEREMLRHRTPDAASCLREPPLRGTDPPSPDTPLVVGAGRVPSGIRASGGEGERERDFRRRCGVLDDAPVVVPLGGGVAVRGPRPLVTAVVRALVVQLGLQFGRTQLALVGDDLDDMGLGGFASPGATRRGVFRVGIARAGATTAHADSVLWALGPAEDVPIGPTTVLDVSDPGRATLRTPRGVVEIAVECLSREQAIGAALLRTANGDEPDVLPDSVPLDALDLSVVGEGLAAAVGRPSHDEAMVLDIVEDGPHAIVTGTTGTGKSELLVSWVAAIASVHGPDRVAFVLADFKGGTAFEPLRALPQVTAVITDLDESGARRGVTSLTAELRRRETLLSAAGVRDIRDIREPRLVIVIDEFAALLQEHPDLGAVFTDIAARGRALGMHLIIGTQRASGVIRDALSANCPLRISLRVGDPGDSRAVIGTDAAAELPGGAASRGIALVRRPQDVEPVMMRVALTAAGDLRRVAAQWEDAHAPHSPWLPALPHLLPIEELLIDVPDGCAVLGRADEPHRQRQPLEVLRIGADRGLAVLGGAGSGRTSLLRALSRQRPDALLLPEDPEEAWDVIERLAHGRAGAPSLVLCDDLDAHLAAYPPDYAQVLAQRWEQALRAHPRTTFVITATKATGASGRLIDMLPHRGLLRMGTRIDHLAAGGDADGFDPARPPGRVRIGSREVQLAWTPEQRLRSAATRPRAAAPPRWSPRAAVTALVTSGAREVVEAVRRDHPDIDAVLLTGETPPLFAGTRPTVLVGEPDSWQRHWALWQRARRDGEVLIRAEHPAELRQLAGVRELPPFARTHAGRAWALTGGQPPRRVVVAAVGER